MRISDWSSDVCSSDLRSFEHSAKLQGGAFVEFTISSGFCLNPFSMIDAELAGANEDYLLDCMAMLKAIVSQMARHIDRLNDTERGLIDGAVNSVWQAKRSEEHTSELQSLMRISYAVFCLKKKKNTNKKQ